MKIGIIIGSMRKNSQSRKIGDFISKHYNLDFEVIDVLDLPSWADINENDEAESKWSKTSQIIKNCDGFVVITPEWSGMATPAIKDFFLKCSDNELANKPGLIVTVSAGRGGTYPVAELHMTSAKNTGIIYIPQHVIISKCNEVLNGGVVDGKADQYIRDRLDYGIKCLEAYSVGLSDIRNKGIFDYEKFPFGM